MTTYPQIHWQEGGVPRSARWRSENSSLPPKRVVLSDDTLNADTAYRYACEGTAMLWRGDFHNARQLLQALARRIDRRTDRPRSRAAQAGAAVPPVTAALAFHQHRQAQAQRAKVLGMVLIGLEADYGIPLRRAPDLRLPCSEAWGEADLPPVSADGQPGAEPAPGSVASLRELMGLVGAHEWRKKGVDVPALARPGQPPDDQRIHPHYGIFSPVRGEYVDLVAQAPLPAGVQRAFDIGVGTGVLSAVLARRGVPQVLATDQDPRALACARDNLERLGLSAQVSVIQADLFPPLAEGLAELIVCNPPWVPAKASSPVEHAVYDPGSRMLKGFLQGLAPRLAPGGEGWLILSDLAEHLDLRPRAELLAWIAAAGLTVLGRRDVRPRHGKAADATDPLHAARAAEVTSLWRLGVAP